MEKKYRLTDETMTLGGITLHRIEALRDFGNVRAGEKGGWIEKESNLSHEGNCWIGDNAKVYDDTRVSENAKVLERAKVYGITAVCGNVVVCGKAKVCDAGWLGGGAIICGDVIIHSLKDYIVFKNWWSSGRYFTWTRSNNMWRVGCFYGSSEELIRKAYEDSEMSGREYERIVRYVEEILQADGKQERRRKQ